jgi:DNA-binding transcriptional LysR family regulator
VPEQYMLLAGGRLDIGIGRASLAPREVASELFRLDPLGVLVSQGHRFASSPGVPVAALAEEPLMLAEEQRAPEFNQFVIELCRSVGFLPPGVPRDRAGWNLPTRRPDEGGLPAAVISCADKTCSDWPFPPAAQCVLLTAQVSWVASPGTEPLRPRFRPHGSAEEPSRPSAGGGLTPPRNGRPSGWPDTMHRF